MLFFCLIHKIQQCLKIPGESPIWNSDKALSFFLVPEKGTKNSCVSREWRLLLAGVASYLANGVS
jgi:hypothetical protein